VSVVYIEATSTLRADGTAEHFVRITYEDTQNGCSVRVHHRCTASAPGQQPSLRRCAEIALGKLQTIARDAAASMAVHGLLETAKPPSGGPYR
jgi:hypothetical protein